MNTIKKFIHYYGPYKAVFFIDLICAAVISLVDLAYPQILRTMTKTLFTQDKDIILHALPVIAASLFVMYIVQSLCKYYVTYQGHMMGAKMERDMRRELFDHYQELSFSYYSRNNSGQMMSKLVSDLFDISEFAHHGPENLFISLVKIVGAFIFLFFINKKLALPLILLVIVMFVFSFRQNAKMQETFMENRRKIGDVNASLQDTLSGIRVVKSFGNEKREIEKFRKGNERFVDAKRVTYRYMAGYHAGMDAFTTLITVAALVSGAMFLASGSISATDLVTFLLYINNFTEPVTKLVNFTEQFQNGYSGYDRFLEMMSIAPDIEDAPDAVPLDHVDGDIRFENVSFHYEDHDDKVLSNVNLEVKPGDYVALVGTSGAGKTTLCSLIPRFYDVTEGAIYLDGKDIRKIKLKDLRQQIGIVQQDVYLFAGNIMENIRYGRPDATDEEVIRAAKLANAHDFIMEMPDNYGTDIGQRGVKLSGGQKQRLSIARAFLKNPPILIFDEATSALDNESEKVVQQSLERLAKDRTTFVIAHRLSTIRNARRILVLTEDGIAEEGTHQELMEKDGVYAKLCKAGL